MYGFWIVLTIELRNITVLTSSDSDPTLNMTYETTLVSFLLKIRYKSFTNYLTDDKRCAFTDLNYYRVYNVEFKSCSSCLPFAGSLDIFWAYFLLD